jgi:hypothetical protein
MKLKGFLSRYVAAVLLLVAVASLLAASVLLLVSVYLLGAELLRSGELYPFCPPGNSSVHCASRWRPPMVGGLLLILVGSVLWPMGIRRWR